MLVSRLAVVVVIFACAVVGVASVRVRPARVRMNSEGNREKQ